VHSSRVVRGLLNTSPAAADKRDVRSLRSSVILSALFAGTAWLTFGDASPWRTATIALGAGLIAWALRRAPQAPPAPQPEDRDRSVPRPCKSHRQIRRVQDDRAKHPPRDVGCSARVRLRGRRQPAPRRTHG